MSLSLTPLVILYGQAKELETFLADVRHDLNPDEAPYAWDCLESAASNLKNALLWIEQAQKSVATVMGTRQSRGRLFLEEQ
jgi:hypothetical protein